MKRVSIVIPVYNEEKLLRIQVKRIIKKLARLETDFGYEIILAENGSTDRTFEIASRLHDEYPQVSAISISQASYGQSFRAGIMAARYDVVAQFDIDFWDIPFLAKAMTLIDQYDVVIGSKNLSHSFDRRPLGRRVMSKFIEVFINTYFGVKITDTHGLKMLRKKTIEPLIGKVILANHFFDSELLIRAYKKGARFIELPVDLQEIRQTRFSFIVRTSQVMKELIQLISIRPLI